MSTLGSIRTSGIAAALGLMSCCLLGPILLDSPSQAQEEKSSKEEMKMLEKREPIPFSTEKRSSYDLKAGTSKTLRPGVNGEKNSSYKVYSKDGEEIRRELITSKVIRKPVSEVVAEGMASRPASRGNLASRGGLARYKSVVMVATGYDPSPASNGGNRSGRGATGLKIGHGLVAVDPRFIPLGTKLYIEGYGYAVAGDTGSAIKGNRIDLGHDTAEGAARVGRRKVVVHILD